MKNREKRIENLQRSNKESHRLIVDSLRQALYTMLKTRDIDSIKVVDLVKAAGVSRGGFYRNFYLVTDVIICSLLLFLPEKNFSDMCYGLEELVVFSLMIDIVVGGKRSSYQLLVFSEHYKEIADHIINNMDRGVTLLKAQGWYTKKDKDVLLILINQKELPSLTRVIKEVDPRAFMSISPTNNVYGEGFEEIKTGVSLKKKKK